MILLLSEVTKSVNNTKKKKKFNKIKMARTTVMIMTIKMMNNKMIMMLIKTRTRVDCQQLQNNEILRLLPTRKKISPLLLLNLILLRRRFVQELLQNSALLETEALSHLVDKATSNNKVKVNEVPRSSNIFCARSFRRTKSGTRQEKRLRASSRFILV